jgi:hypothetical protein
VSGEHWDHDIHGPVLLVGPGSTLVYDVDEDCDCPPDCEPCEAEGVTR